MYADVLVNCLYGTQLGAMHVTGTNPHADAVGYFQCMRMSPSKTNLKHLHAHIHTHACAQTHMHVHTQDIFSKYRKTHNEAVFDIYSPDVQAARSAKLLTGLPDAYGRGRIIGDYR